MTLSSDMTVRDPGRHALPGLSAQRVPRASNGARQVASDGAAVARNRCNLLDNVVRG